MSSWGALWERVQDLDFRSERPPWKFYKLLLNGQSLKGKRVVELGCGTGMNSMQFALAGARVTLVDFSKEALALARRNFEKHGLDAEYVHGDILDLRLKGFDIAHSDGVIEHFLGKARQGAVDAHADAVKKGGEAVIVVPHARNLFYQVGKAAAKATGTWPFGNEYPYTWSELRQRLGRAGLAPAAEEGGELLFSLFWAFSPVWLGSDHLLRRTFSSRMPAWMERANQGHWLAKQAGRVIGVRAVKK
ncbi:MAG TPA: class I SAM-dependent methyltransferase [archaeon]|nr:class I SAM-dependent methyltransferase [archaeon]